VEFVVFAFEGNRFTGRIMPELNAAREKGIIRIVDLLFLKKDEHGSVTVTDLSDMSAEDAAPYSHLAGEILGLLAPEDIELTASYMPDNSSSAVLLFEHTWAIGLKEAIRDAGGRALTGGLLAPDVLQMVEAEIEAKKQGTRQEKAEV
jgi:hypothetical protein